MAIYHWGSLPGKVAGSPDPQARKPAIADCSSNSRRVGGKKANAMTETAIQTNAATVVGTSSLAKLRAQCALAFMIGASLIFMVGFAHSDVLHNAAHDTRHSLAFPCH